MVTGAVAGVGSTYQFIPKQIHILMKLISEGKITEARVPQLKIQQVCRIMYEYGKDKPLISRIIGDVKQLAAIVNLMTSVSKTLSGCSTGFL